jgi:hypothetical protein
MGYGGPNPTYFLQTPKEVWIIHSEQVRRVYMGVPHSENPKPSPEGESVGHYEGDTLVVDTIGQSERSFVDIYRTPHTEKLHVVKRWRIVDDGKMMEATFTVDDTHSISRGRESGGIGVRSGGSRKTSAPRTTSIYLTITSQLLRNQISERRHD